MSKIKDRAGQLNEFVIRELQGMTKEQVEAVAALCYQVVVVDDKYVPQAARFNLGLVSGVLNSIQRKDGPMWSTPYDSFPEWQEEDEAEIETSTNASRDGVDPRMTYL